MTITIISGGQTGVDRAALDFAIEAKLLHGGWCPKGRLAEDGILEKKYKLQETPEENYSQRTLWNVRDSDGTVIFSIAKMLEGGSKKTEEFAIELKKPVVHISKKRDKNPARILKSFLKKNEIRILNIAGPRASKEPEVYNFVREVLERSFYGAC